MAPRAAGSADRKAAVAEGRSIACDEIAVIAREIAVVGSREICFGVIGPSREKVGFRPCLVESVKNFAKFF